MKRLPYLLILLVLLSIPQLGFSQEASPGTRNAHDLIYFPKTEEVLLINGLVNRRLAGLPTEIWAWDGEFWDLLEGDAPQHRLLAAVSYDSQRERIVMFGGWFQGDERLNDTWEWDGENWIQLHPETSPSPRDHIAMVYDEAHGYSIFFAGVESSTSIFSETWAWDGTNWTLLTTEGPVPRAHYALVYDPLREEVLMLGGIDNTFTAFDEMWSWDGEAWQQIETELPPPRDAARMVFDPRSGQILLFGGRGEGGGRDMLHDTWAWNGENWTELHPETSPSPRSFHSMTYDAAREQIVLYGGFDGRNSFDDFWAWDGENWIEINP
jgi:hypothetical protein